MDDLPLRTERLRLRHWRDADREPFAALNADPEVMEFYPAPLTRAESDALLDRLARTLLEQGWGIWAVESDEGFIGFTGLAIPRIEAPFLPAVEIAWRLARPAWGHGFAQEAARAVLGAAFAPTPRGLGLDQVIAYAVAGNQRSLRVMDAIGMVHDVAADFDHPDLPAGHPLRRHVLYRAISDRAGPE